MPFPLSEISILISCRSDQKQDIQKTIESILNLKGKNWEIILVPEKKNAEANLAEEFCEDNQIKYYNPEEHDLFDLISGDFIVHCQAGDQFYKGLLIHFYHALTEDNSADWHYYDCEFIDRETDETLPLFKPQSLSPTLLCSLNYLSRGIIRTSFFKEYWAATNFNQNLSEMEYELALNLCENGGNITHIPKILVRQTSLIKPDTKRKQEKIIAHLSIQGLRDVTVENNPIGTRFLWQTTDPSVAIIIPTKNNRKLLSNCLNSLVQNTHHKNFTIHIVDNNSDDPETLDFYRSLRKNSQIKIHTFTTKFNYSQAINLGVTRSESDLVLFLNDDVEIYDPDWLTELVQWAIRPEIGVVGPKLIRANHTIQHAGIIIGLHGLAGHIYLNAPQNYKGLFGSVDWYRDYLALTGACQIVRRVVFNQVKGYDEGYRIAFGDIDFCLRVHQAGYLNIYTPFATLFHYEGRSRGYITPKGDILRGYQQMGSMLTNEDPFFSPNLSYTRIPRCILSTRTPEERENFIKLRKKFHEKK